MSPAYAIASVGATQNCDSYGHCVTGAALSSNGAVDIRALGANGLGTAIAVCEGSANGSVLLAITCSVGSSSQTISFPGTAGAVPVASDTSTLSRLPVCWNVVGYFPNLSGPPFTVSTSGCALVAL